MNEPTRSIYAAAPRAAGRLWGLDVIVAGYAIGAALCAYLVFAGDPLAKWSGVVGGPVCVLAAFGVAFRANKVRLGLIVLTSVAFAASVFFECLMLWHQKPLELRSVAIQAVLTFLLIGYLLRRDVRAAFQAPHNTNPKRER